MSVRNEQKNAGFYLLLLAIQISGAIIFVWQNLPEFRQVALNPGRQLQNDIFSDLILLCVFTVMQIAYWYRLLKVEVPSHPSSMVFSHIFLFLGRLSFMFGSALFSVVVFRHLPELGQETDMLLMFRRAILFVGGLFALFCASLEVERLGQSLATPHN